MTSPSSDETTGTPAPSASSPAYANLCRTLIQWFNRCARDLPWRRTTDPYAIWISEIMLQQTQVKTVIPYWERWMIRFPDVSALADARLDDVLKCWEGLGYYSRARNLHRAAQILQEEYNGQLPSCFDLLMTLPGIGRYTAGAICSIAFHQPKPVLDGNVTRVLTRLFGINGSLREKETSRQLWDLADSLVNSATPSGTNGRPGGHRERLCYSKLNQALMELGATICTPRDPCCSHCPVRNRCIAHRTHAVDRYPNTAPRRAPTRRYFIAFAIRHRDRWLVRQRDGRSVNGLLWEFPNIEMPKPARPSRRLIASCVGLEVDSIARLCIIKHTITRYRIVLDVLSGQLDGRKIAPGTAAGNWRSLAELDKLAFPSAHRKIIETLKAT